MKYYKKLIIISILVLVPFVFLGLVEAALRLGGIGYNTDPFMPSKNDSEILVENPDFFRKYGYTEQEIKVASGETILAAQKKEKGFRAFVLGGSTAQGFPYPVNHSFSEIFETTLRASEKYEEVEVINLGASAMSSYYVADAAQKILQYDPDLVVVYAGHNEYYGLVSESTGTFHQARKLFLSLQELRVFQWFTTWMASWSAPQKDSLMAQRFQNQQFPADRDRDRAVAENFHSNIGEVVALFKSRGVPVLLVSPASNLLDMPPFKDPEGEPELTESFLKARESLLSKEEVGFGDLAELASIKDRDSIPFRARDVLLNGFTRHQGEGVAIINFQQALADRLGRRGMGSRVFIDHLHLNFDGQAFLADELLRSWAKMDNWPLENALKARSALEPVAVRLNLFYLPYYEFVPYWIIERLTASSPYTEMEQQPFFLRAEDLVNEISADPDLYIALKEAFFQSPEKAYGLYLDRLTKEDPKKALNYVQANVLLYPSYYGSYWNAAQFFMALDQKEAALPFIERTHAFGGWEDPQIVEQVKTWGLELKQ